MQEAIQIPVRGAPVDWVSGFWDLPETEKSDFVFLLAHGAGLDMSSDFMAYIAQGLAAAGFPVMRFNYAYSERMDRGGNRRPPDRRPMLEAVHRGALEFLRRRYPDARVVLAGKSMGGRMASYLTAEGVDAAALCCFGYPLYPPGKPEKLRSEHFPTIAQPALFLQGTRDTLCDLELLKPALETYGGQSTLEIIEGADHGFRVLKKLNLSDEEVQDDLVQRTVKWVESL
ncbi:MAG: putative alpha/beta-hydrolase family hydrolase [Glaciecola sp.]